jgi:hypothetical protein
VKKKNKEGHRTLFSHNFREAAGGLKLKNPGFAAIGTQLAKTKKDVAKPNASGPSSTDQDESLGLGDGGLKINTESA